MSQLDVSPVRVRVVIPCRNEEGYIGTCLRSIIAAERGGMILDVRVCDGHSDDGTRAEVEAITAAHPWITLVDNPARTTPQAMNLGLRPPGYDVGIILGAHAAVAPDFITCNIAALRAHPDAGCAGGVIENVYLDASSRRIGAAMGHPIGVGTAHFRTGLKEGYVDTVAFGAYRREVFERVGYFDERLVRNQDDEFNYRVVKAGFRIWLSTAIKSRYYVRGSYGKLFRQYRQYGYWKVYVNRMHRTVTTWRQVVPALFVAGAIGGAIIALFIPKLWIIWAAAMAMYVLLAMAGAVHAAKRAADIPGVLFAFFVLHSSYGIGYLQGLADILLLRKQPVARGGALTR